MWTLVDSSSRLKMVAVVRFRFAACGIAGGAGQGDSLGQRELDGAVHHDGRSRFVAGRALAAAGGQSHGGAGQSGGLEEVAAGNHLFHGVFSFFFLVCVLQGFGRQPLMEPAMMPASKYFWKKGYMTIKGRLEMMMVHI